MVIDGHRGAAVGASHLRPENIRHFRELVVASTRGQICS